MIAFNYQHSDLNTRGSLVASKPGGLGLPQRGLNRDSRSQHGQEVSFEMEKILTV
jgi:hypothetical protein